MVRQDSGLVLKACLRRPGTFLKKGSWTSKNFCLEYMVTGWEKILLL